LLDWTESFATSLYFTSYNWAKNNTITVWMLNPLGLNKKTLGNSRFFTSNTDLYRNRIESKGEKPLPNNSLALHPLRNIY
jgi:hypothetical protein